MDVLFLSRLQFALTIGFHFIFPPISIGLAWFLVVVEGIGWKTGNDLYVRMAKYFAKLLAITFAMGVATGIVMEFQFGTNWAQYSKFVGDIFGAPLAAEGIFAFFLESVFLGLYLFGRNKVSKGVHWLSSFLVALGATISGFWIIAANSWQQTPTGYVLRNGRAEMTNFADTIFNPSTMIRYLHTIDSTLIVGAFFVAGIAAYLLLKNSKDEIGRSAMKLAVIGGLIFSLLEVYPLGDQHSRQVARTQPEKFAALMGVYTTGTNVPLVIFAIPTSNPPALKMEIGIPSMLSFLTFDSTSATIRGTNEFPADELPPLKTSFITYHGMVALGMYFVAIMLLAVFLLYRKKLWENTLVLKLLLFSIPLPVIAIELGWAAAEVGRQPWIVYKLLRTRDAISPNLSAGEVLFSIFLFGVVYLFLFIVYLYLMFKKVKQGPEETLGKEAEL